MADPVVSRLLSFARELQRASTFPELLDAARAEVRASVGYEHAWLMVADDEDVHEVKLIGASSDLHDLIWEFAPTLTIAGDAMLEEIVGSDAPVVVTDARTDPRTNKEIVAQLGNRTIVNIPLRLLDKPFGAFGCGTFGDEGVRPPSAAQLDFLIGMAGQLAVAAGRIRFLEHQRLSDRVRKDLERRLTQVQKLESLGLLAGGVAHDFNNLLTVILSCASMAQQETSDPRALEELDAIVEASRRGSQLTQQLLSMSRAQSLELRDVDLTARIRELVTLLRRVFPASVEIDRIEHAGDTLVRGDPSQLDQVLMNLCINARDALPDGGRLTIETEQVLVNGAFTETHPWASPGRYLLVTVTDTGVGMPPDVVDRVFEPFFTTKNRAGTGLGLAVAYGIVTQHGGMLHCYSEVGVGTTFKMYLPLSARAAGDVGTKLDGPVTGGTERLLVAEDDAAIGAVVTRILERAGYSVSLVTDGQQAMDAVAAGTFDLVLLDVVMPGPSCAETLHGIRSVAPDTPVLLASGYSAGTNVAELIRETNAELLTKPYDPDKLLRTIRRALATQPKPASPG